MAKMFKRDWFNIITVIISAGAAFYTYQSTVVTRNIEKNNRYIVSSAMIRTEGERAIRYSESIYRAFEEYVSLVNSDKAYQEMKTDVYNKPAERISSLVREINIDDLKDELIRIESTETNNEVAENANILNSALEKMVLACTALANDYSAFGKTKSMLGNLIDRTGENKELITRRYQLTEPKFKETYKSCEDNLSTFKEDKKKFLESYKQVLSKI